MKRILAAAFGGLFLFGALAWAGVNYPGSAPVWLTYPPANTDGIVNPVTIVAGGSSGATGTYTNKSGTITLGGTSQTLAAINTSRKDLIVQNPCTASESLFINWTSAASSSGGSVELRACGTFTPSPGFISTELVTVVAATTGHAFTAKEGQ